MIVSLCERTRTTNINNITKSQSVEKVAHLKKQNEFNQQLLKQSLSFVQLSLDLLSPEIDTYNYERT